MSEKKEIKAFDFKVEEADSSEGTGVIAGFASTFGNVDLGGDLIKQGAFKKTLIENLHVPILLDHNPTKPAGHNLEGAETPKGLRIKGEVLLEGNEVKHRFKLAKRAMELKAKSSLSIGYSAIKVSFDEIKKQRVRILEEIKLWEYSMVTFPMNPKAVLTNVKSEQLYIDTLCRLKDGHFSEGEILEALAKVGITPKQAAYGNDDPEILQSLNRLITQMRS